MLEKEISAIAATGVKVIVAGGKIGDLCLHYLNKYGIMAVRLSSKFDLRRLCKSINATALPRLVCYPLLYKNTDKSQRVVNNFERFVELYRTLLSGFQTYYSLYLCILHLWIPITISLSLDLKILFSTE